MTKKLVVVSGAGGFIGGHLVKYLLDDGFNVNAVDIKPLNDWYQIDKRAKNFSGEFDGDCRDFKVCRSVCHGASEVYQLAADMGGMGFIENNKALCMLSVLTNTHMLLAAQEAGVNKFFFSSSACVYNAEKQNIPNLTALKEQDAYPALPEDGYGWEKLFSERMCRHFREDFGLQTRIARFHNVYGPFGTWEGGREKAPAALCRKVIEAKYLGSDSIEIWGDGTQTRSFMYIDDCIEGIMKIMRSDVLEPLNLGSSELVSINQLLNEVEDIAGTRLNRIYNLDAPKGVAGRNSDNTKILNSLKWEPTTKLSSGLRKTYMWIEGEFLEKVHKKRESSLDQSSTRQTNTHPIPGDGFNPHSQYLNTWIQGIPATYLRKF